MFPVFFICRPVAFTQLSHSTGNGSKEAERGCKHSVTIDLDLLFLQEQKGTAKGQLRVKILYYIQIHSSAEEEIRSVIEWSMRNRLTTEVAVNTMLGDTPPTPALPPLKGNEGPRSRRF